MDRVDGAMWALCRVSIVALGIASAGVLAACGDDDDGDDDEADGDADADVDADADADSDADGDGDGDLDVAVCDPAQGAFSDPLTIDNPYFPLPEGGRIVIEGEEDEALVRVRITVLADTLEVAGVMTRVVEEYETEDDELVEVSRNYFAQTDDGTVCYFGEEVDIYEGGEITAHDGAWQAGVDGARPGIVMPAHPEVGMRFAQEVAPGVAEDTAEITEMGVQVTVPLGTYTDTILMDENSPLDQSASHKTYAAGIGMIIDDTAQLIEATGF
jgi:hypothetical protein